MRNLFIGAALAAAFTAGAAVIAPASPTPEQAAANAVQKGFVGRQQIGAWTVGCRQVFQKAPGLAKATAPVTTTTVINKNGQKMLNVDVYIPPRPCRVIDVLKQADRPERETSAWFVLQGPYGVLVMIFHAPVELFPGTTKSPIAPPKSGSASANGTKQAPASSPDSDSGAEFVALAYDGATNKGPVIVCGPFACIARIKIPHADEAKFLASKHVALEFPAFPGKRPLRMDLPTSGLPEAIAALRRVEK